MNFSFILDKFFISDIGYTVKLSELMYYWIISLGLLSLAYKTYKNSIKQETLLAVQLTFDDIINSENLHLEIYNYGNYIAKDIYIQINNTSIIDLDNSIFNNNLGFIKPNSSKRLPVGCLLPGGISFFGKAIDLENFSKENIKITVKYNKNSEKELEINTSFLTSLNSLLISDNQDTKEISKSLKSIDRSINDCKNLLEKNRYR